MRNTIFVITLLLAGAADTSCNLSGFRLSAGMVKVGDSERRVIETKPDRVMQLDNRYSDAAGIRYDSHRRNQTVQVPVKAARITRVDTRGNRLSRSEDGRPAPAATF